MNQTERRLFLIHYLLNESPQYNDLTIPSTELEQKQFLRSLVNIRMPNPISNDFLKVQDAYLQEELKQHGAIDYKMLQPIQEEIYLWQGDITKLRCNAIVNAANSQLLGCFYPCHKCIDNAIHTFSGVQLRLTCHEMMQYQGHEEETGKAKITPAFNLPCNFILHTVGPIVKGQVTKKDTELLASCYRSCLELADQNDIKSIAFCCISTGEFHFPNELAAGIAIQTVKDYKGLTQSKIEVIFNVFKDRDYDIYKRKLESGTKIKR